ncbi:MAG: S8 family serine peptidase [Prosthecobacter sp.]
MKLDPHFHHRRRAFMLLLVCLGLAGLLLKWGPESAPQRVIAERPTPEKTVPAAVLKRAVAEPAEEMLAEGSVTLPMGEGLTKRYRVALDELHFQSPGAESTRTIERCDSVQALLEVAEAEAKRTGVWPGLVLYAEDEPVKTETRRILTGRVLVRLHDEKSAMPALGTAGLRLVERPDYSRAHLVVESLSGSPIQALKGMSQLSRDRRLASVTPLLKRMVKPAQAPNDPFYDQQWHLENTGQGGGRKGIDIQVKDVWDQYQGQGIRIAIVDDGLELTHPDLAANIDPVSTNHYNFLADSTKPWQQFDPTPNPAKHDYHGTAVAGLSAARGDNGIGMSGVAPKATLVGHRFLDSTAPLDDFSIAEIISQGNDFIHIKNNSWVLGVGYAGLSDIGELFEDAMKNGATNGRGGLGVISVWSAGNGREALYQGSKNGLANNLYSIAVGALTNTGALAAYSETGNHLCVVAPSNGGTLRMVTTDLAGAVGYNPNPAVPDIEDASYNYTKQFGGTSAAAPVVSGVIALMLQANPGLTWRDVKEILLRSSFQVDPTSATWVKRTTRNNPYLPPIKHSPLYGGGLIQAKAAVDLARTWTKLAPMISSARVLEPNVSVNFLNDPTKGTAVAQSSIVRIVEKKAVTMRQVFNFKDTAPIQVEHVTVKLNLTHTYRGDLTISLRSPAGVVSTLATASIHDFGADYPGYTFSTLRHWGESGQGDWTLEITDAYLPNDGLLQKAEVTLYGTAAPGPIMTSQTAPQLIAEGTPTTLSVQSTAPADMKRVWRKDGKVIANQTGAALPPLGLKLTDSGIYDQVITSYYSSVTSAPIPVGIVRRAVPSLFLNEGATAVFKATASGPRLTYQWLKGSTLTPLIENGRVTGTRSPTLTIRDMKSEDAGNYVCRVFMPNTSILLPPFALDTLPANLSLRLRPVIQLGLFDVAGTVGQNVSRLVTTNTQVTRYIITGLPPGVTYNATTGAITGIPTAAGFYVIYISATNAIGTSTPARFEWNITPPVPLAAGLIGTFHGLVDRHAFYTGGLGGSLLLTTTSFGSYSGIITRGFYRHTFTGSLAITPTSASGEVSLSRRTPYGPLRFRFSLLLSAPGTLTGTLDDPAMTVPDIASVTARRAAFSETSPATAFVGRWNTTYELPIPLIGNATYPQGASWGTQTVSSSGVATWAGRLADGTVLTSSCGIAENGLTPLHFMIESLYGSVQGWQTLNGLTNLSSANLNWVKAAYSTRSYAEGFPLHSLTGTGGRYTPPLISERLFGIALGADNAVLNLTQGGLTVPIAQSFTLDANNAIVMPAVAFNPHQIQLTLDLTTGQLTGTGTALDIDPNNLGLNRQRTGTLSGLLNPASETAVGHFLLPAAQSSTAPILSGKFVGEEAAIPLN